ncbi:hypothetical protein PInf_014692 [Phytophthora infestans]|nr:hypothetical protein PInf_014692 [Phytophthora infestans]
MLKRLVKLYIVTGGRILPTVTITKLKFLDVGPKLQNNPRLIRAGDEIILDGKRIRAVGHDAVSVVECDATNLHQDFEQEVYLSSVFKLPGATTIITSSSDEKLKFVQEKFGADHVINYKTHPDWATVANQITSGRGADFVLENGGSGTITQSIEAIAAGGIISVIGFLSPVKQEDMPDLTVLLLASSNFVPWCSFISDHHIQPFVQKTFGFNREEVFAAFDYLQTGRHIGKIGIEIKLAYGLKPEKRSSQTSRVFFWLVNEEEEDKENWKEAYLD